MTMKSDNTWKMWGVSSHDIKLEEDFKWRKLCYFSFSYRIQSEASSESEWERNVIKIKRDSIFMAFLRSLSLPCSHSLSSNQHKNWSWLAAAATKERELHKDTLGVNSIYDFFFFSHFFIYSSSAEWKCRFLYILVVDTKITLRHISSSPLLSWRSS